MKRGKRVGRGRNMRHREGDITLGRKIERERIKGKRNIERRG